MIKLEELSLLNLLPDNLSTDQQIHDAALAIDIEMKSLTSQLNNLDVISRMNTWTSEEVDELAWQNHVDYYDPELPLQKRRQLVAESISIHRRKGTKSAVEDLIKIIFGYGRIEEWFQYGSQPGYFQVITDNPAINNEDALKFLQAIDSVKRLTAHLERVILERTTPADIKYGIATHRYRKITARQV